MNSDRPSNAEIKIALDQCAAQAAHLHSLGRANFVGDAVSSQVAQLAASQLIIRFQAVLDDLGSAFAQEHHDLPFNAVRGMRNRLAHGYSDVDPNLLWNTMETDLPAFIDELRERLSGS